MSNKVGKNMQGWVLGMLVCLVFFCAGKCMADDNLYVSAVYYGGDWGPALVKKATEKEPAVYDDNHEVVYFIKHAVTYRGQKGLGKLKEGEYDFVEDRLILCVMEADGSGKQEIADLWVSRDKEWPPKGPTPGTYEGVCLDVSPKGRRAAWSVERGSSEVKGLWTFNLDGSGFRRISEAKEVLVERIMRVSWVPDGEWMVFEKYYGDDESSSHILRCDKDGSNCVALTKEFTDTQPTVSPDGKTIAYTCWPIGRGGSSSKPHETLAKGSALARKYGGNLYGGARYIQVMNVDGSNQRPLYEQNGKAVWGTYPMWSPDGTQLAWGSGVFDLVSKDVKSSHMYIVYGNWGKAGIVGWMGKSIILYDVESGNKTRLLGPSGTTKVPAGSTVREVW